MEDQWKLLIPQVLREYWNHSPDMVYAKDLNGVYLCASKPFAESVGLEDPAELVGKSIQEIYPDGELARRYLDDEKRLLESGKPLEGYVEPFAVRDGKPLYCITSKYILRDADGKACGTLGISRDITREYEARQSYENELRSLFVLPDDALMTLLLDLSEWRVVDARLRNGENRIITSFSRADEYFASLLPAIDDEEVRAFFSQISPQRLRQRYENGARSFSLEYRRRLPARGERWVRDEFRFLSDPITGNLSAIVTLRDIDAEKQQYSQLLQAAEQDPMTLLLNRAAIMKQVEQYLAGEGQGKFHALFMIDLDNFKHINDSFGHQYGDHILQDAAKTIRAIFRTTDLVGRMGGDEFIALMKDAGNEENVRHKAAALVAGLQLSARRAKQALEITSSVGFTLLRGGESNFATLYQEADTALYQSKKCGKNQYSMFGGDAEPDAEGEDDPRSVDTVHLRTLLDYMDGSVMLLEVGEEIRITYVSPSTYRTFDFLPKAPDPDGTSLFSVVLKADLPGLQKALRLSAQDNRLLDYSFRVQCGDSIEWRHIRAKRIPRRGDSVRRMVAVITDITPIKRAEAQLREAEMRYRIAMEQTDVLLWEVELNTRTMHLISPAWTQHGARTTVFFNAPESYLRESRVHPDSVEECRRLFDDIYAGREGEIYFLRGYDHHGEEFWVKDQFRLLRDECGRPVRAVCTTQPVLDIKEELARQAREIPFSGLI